MRTNICKLLAATFVAISAAPALAQTIAPPDYLAPPTCAELSVQCPCSPEDRAPCPVEEADCLAPERFSVELLAGYYSSFAGLGPGAKFDPAHPHAGAGKAKIDYAPIDLRIGYRPYLPLDGESSRWCDHVQVLVGLATEPITRGAGNLFIGPELMLRYNFANPASPLTPYIQAGGGIVTNDEFKDKTQRAIGEAIEFEWPVQAGLRWQVSDQWSVQVEGGCEHISNGGLAARNGGINNLGASIGFAYVFGGH
jgi:Lipid A 3-O-deacylase (PagL)